MICSWSTDLYNEERAFIYAGNRFRYKVQHKLHVQHGTAKVRKEGDATSDGNSGSNKIVELVIKSASYDGCEENDCAA